MLSAGKFRELCKQRNIANEKLGEELERSGLTRRQAIAAVKNWKRGLFKPAPTSKDIERLATALVTDANAISEWRSSYRYAPGSARKARLVTELINGRGVQEAIDILKFTDKRAAGMVDKVLKAAVADADEQQADVESLHVSSARVDDAGIWSGTKRWIPKDRGRAHPIRKKACYIHVSVAQD